MRLLHFAESGEVVGGVERYLETLLAAEDGPLEHAVITHAGGPCRYAGRWPSASWPWKGPRSHIGPMPVMGEGLPVFHGPPSPAAVAELGKGPFAIFCHDHSWWCPSATRFYLRNRHGCDITAATHRCGLRYHFMHCGSLRPLPTLTGFVDAALSRGTLAAASTVLCASSYMKGEAIRHGAQAARVFAVPLPTALSSPPLPPPSGVPVILSPNRLTPEKGVDALLDAFGLMRAEARLVICGDGIQTDEITAMVDVHPFKGRITMAGRLGGEALAEQFRQASVVAAPSLWPEPFGLVGIEALALGKPVVTSGSGGIADWASEALGVLTAPPLDAVAFAAALDRAVSEPVWAERARTAGADWVRDRHNLLTHVASLTAALS